MKTGRVSPGPSYFLNQNLIYHKTKTQGCISLSTYESETNALFQTIKVMIGIINTLKELKIQLSTKPVIYCDNQAAISACSFHKVFRARSKHLDIKILWMRHQVQDGKISLKYINTSENPADLMTKPLPAAAHHKHKKTILNH